MSFSVDDMPLLYTSDAASLNWFMSPKNTLPFLLLFLHSLSKFSNFYTITSSCYFKVRLY